MLSLFYFLCKEFSISYSNLWWLYSIPYFVGWNGAGVFFLHRNDHRNYCSNYVIVYSMVGNPVVDPDTIRWFIAMKYALPCLCPRCRLFASLRKETYWLSYTIGDSTIFRWFFSLLFKKNNSCYIHWIADFIYSRLNFKRFLVLRGVNNLAKRAKKFGFPKLKLLINLCENISQEKVYNGKRKVRWRFV